MEKPLSSHPVIYLSGPITGYSDFNYRAFEEAEASMYRIGAKRVYNPLKCQRQLDDDGEPLDSHDYWMRVSLAEISRHRDGDPTKPMYDAIVMLPGYQNSLGCSIELQCAISMGIKVIVYDPDIFREDGEEITYGDKQLRMFPMELADTVSMMVSDSWEDRLRAEYHQLVIREGKLRMYTIHKTLEDGDPSNSEEIRLLKRQGSLMRLYKRTLERRAELCGVDL